MFFSQATVESVSRAIGVDLMSTFFGNTLFAYALSVASFIVLALFFRFIQWGLLRRLEKFASGTKTDIDDIAISIVRSLRPAFYYFLAFFGAVQFLVLSSVATSVVEGILLIWIVYQAVVAIQILIERVLKRRFAEEAPDPGTKAAIEYVNIFVKIGLWSVGVLLVLSNFGVNITSLVAGLGIGGIAIAFALQNILGDLFSSFAIYFDKPFEIGDFIVTGEHSGTVEKVGIKTTRIRSISGEEIVIPNQELTSTRVQNFRRMDRRRIVFTLGVLYETPTKKLEKIPDIVNEIFASINDVQLDRVHFKTFNDSSLDFEVVYYVNVSDYATYMNCRQDINFALKARFEKENIEFAYPTRTVYLTK